jgi:hypothetical protein
LAREAAVAENRIVEKVTAKDTTGYMSGGAKVSDRNGLNPHEISAQEAKRANLRSLLVPANRKARSNSRAAD